jgi:hypothetical protein
MCEMCVKQLRHEALEYFKCLYDHHGEFGHRNFVDAELIDEDGKISEETFKHIMQLYSCMKTHELLEQIAKLEEALYNRDERKRSREHLEKMVEKWVVEGDQEEAKVKVNEFHKEQQIKILKEELRTFILNQKGWSKDQVDLLTLDGLLRVARECSYTSLLEEINEDLK